MHQCEKKCYHFLIESPFRHIHIQLKQYLLSCLATFLAFDHNHSTGELIDIQHVTRVCLSTIQ